MSVADSISLIKDIATLLALIIGAAIGLFVFFQLAPILRLRIMPRWTDDSQQFLVVRFEVENSSRVRAHPPTGWIQVLEHTFQPAMILSHYVPFNKKGIISAESPIEWREPVKIFQHTKAIYPGEMISIERLYHYPQDSVIIHIGFQVGLSLGLLGRLFTRSREAWRQTTTCIVVKHSTPDANGYLLQGVTPSPHMNI